MSELEIPPVIAWFRRYCLAVASIYLLIASGGAYLLSRHREMAESAGMEADQMLVFSGLLTLTMVFLAFVHGAASRLPRAPWAWQIGAVVVGLDLTTLVLWPLALPVIWLWMKQDTQVWFGRLQRVEPEAETAS